MLDQRTARDLVGSMAWPALKAEREELEEIDRWYRFDHDRPHAPRQSTLEYRELVKRAQAPWGGLIVTAVAQALYVDGYRSPSETDDAAPWSWWQANGWDRRQTSTFRAALAYGLAYATVLPGEDPMTGEAMPVMRGRSPRRMMAFYADPADDDWPQYALQADPATVAGKPGWDLQLYDDTVIWRFQMKADSDVPTFVEWRDHSIGICPVVRYANQLDLEGRSAGEVEPFIPLLARIDQTVFDRLVVQRFASWKVRTIAGMAKPESVPQEEWDSSTDEKKLKLQVDGILVAEDPDTKFGVLDETPLSGFVEAATADLRQLASVSQTPVHEMLGEMANLSAEALAAARASLSAKVEERQNSFGESVEQQLRLAAYVMGDTAAAADRSAQVRWRDTNIRSLAQAADALGKLAQMLGVPVEVLWEKIPGWTQQDVDRAKTMAEQGGSLEALMRQLAAGQTSPSPAA